MHVNHNFQICDSLAINFPFCICFEIDLKPNRRRRYEEEVARIHRVTVQKRSSRSCPWDYPGKDTGVVCRFLLQVPNLNCY